MIGGSNTEIVFIPYLQGCIVSTRTVAADVLPLVSLFMEHIEGIIMGSRNHHVIINQIIAHQFTYNSRYTARISGSQQLRDLGRRINLNPAAIGVLVEFIRAGYECHHQPTAQQTCKEKLIDIFQILHHLILLPFTYLLFHFSLKSHTYCGCKLLGNRRSHTTGIDKLRILTIQLLVGIKQAEVSG